MPQSDKHARETVTLIGRERLYDGFVELDRYEVEITDGERTARFRREVHHHGHGAAVLPVDPVRRTVLLVRQHRLPVQLTDGDGHLVEACAGLIDEGDADPAAAIAREAREELGFAVHDLERVARIYTCPGVVTETIVCFLATYGEADDIRGEGGGVDDDEMIEVLEWPLERLEAAMASGEIADAKTLVLAQALRLKRPDLFG